MRKGGFVIVATFNRRQVSSLKNLSLLRKQYSFLLGKKAMQPKSHQLSVTILITILAALLGTLSNVLGNLAASTVPTVLLPYLHWAWPAFLLVAILGILVTIWQVRHQAAIPDSPSLPLQPEQTSVIDLLEPLTEKPACAWVIVWQGGEKISNIAFVYDDQQNASRYTCTLQDDLLHVIDEWGKVNPERYHELKEQAECVAVRIRKAKRVQYLGNRAVPEWKFCIWLEPSRYLYYVAIHTQMGKPALKLVRQKYFQNTLIGLENGEELALPSNFALHVAVVSKDRHLLLRQRIRYASHYPLAWEAGVGEVIHGPGPLNGPVPEVRSDPGHSVFSHFRKDRTPDLFLFLKNAIAEELGYRRARSGDFCLYGFAVEYQTLGPKLLAVYHSDRNIEELLQSARGKDVKDPAREVDSIELNPHAIVEAFSNTKYASWEPKSKLLILLALKQDLEMTGKYDQSLEVAKLTERFKIDDAPVDPWKYPK